jgi:hypothetical protein
MDKDAFRGGGSATYEFFVNERDDQFEMIDCHILHGEDSENSY